ncbi:diguanylate cyclase [Paraburkholderia sp. BR10936]|uniref:diguanylate cyclase domain-containing protein n=1 Tax=Paraburkholderia sp. BR10936 TaxID=3236993 RepID=UPI0034D36EEC
MPARLFRSANGDRNRFVTLYYGIVFSLLLAAAMFLYQARVIVQDNLRDEEAFAVLGAATWVLHDLESAETGQRGFLLTGNESYLNPYRQGMNDLDGALLRLKQIVGVDPDSLEVVRRIEQVKTEKVAELTRTVELARAGQRRAAIALVQTDEGRRYMDTLRLDLGQLLDVWRQRRRSATRDAQERIQLETAALAVTAVLVCALMLYALFVQRRAFARMRAWSDVLDRQAAQDPLTGLPNRRRLLAAIAALTEHAGPARVALLYMDIDGFKRVNDALGHSAGDALLCRLAEALRGATREADVLARVGGDEFVLLVKDCGDDSQLRDLAGRLIGCVRSAGERNYSGRFPVGVSVGIATFPDRVQSVEELLDVADAAMYIAKRIGRSTYFFGSSPEPRCAEILCPSSDGAELNE